MTLLSLHNITTAFGGPPLLDGINLQIKAGDRLCLLGRNGSGKSTLLKLIDGELETEQGAIIRRQSLKVALVSQSITPKLTGSVFDVVASGMGNASELLSEYHLAAFQLSQDGNSEERLAHLATLQKKLEENGAWSLHKDVERLLSRLDLNAETPFEALSGGLKRRALLARALIAEPDILALDEPTNHLDFDTIIWLEDFLLKNIKTILFVTHDRAFARRLANRVAELDRGKLYAFDCGYDEFVRRRDDLLAAEIIRQALFDKKLAQEEAWIRQGIKARRTRNEGRVRTLKKMREERSQRRARQGTARVALQEAERSGRLVAEAENLCFGYDSNVIIRNFTATIMRGDRIALIGSNGSGKTTLLRLLLGELSPQSGSITIGTRLETLYFDQMRESLDLKKSVQENVGEGNDTVMINGVSRHIIGYLQDFLFTPDRARSPASVLSGGELNRLLLAKLFTKPFNLLVMDEPTNDLDMETLDLLEELLLEYSGTLLLVSHDREFLDNVATCILFLKGDGSIQEYVGGYKDWLRQSASETQSLPSSPEQPEQNRQKQKTLRPRRLNFKEERELEALPDIISALEEEQEELHVTLGDPDFYKDNGSGIQKINVRLEELTKELSEAYNRWEELETLKQQKD